VEQILEIQTLESAIMSERLNHDKKPVYGSAGLSS